MCVVSDQRLHLSRGFWSSIISSTSRLAEAGKANILEQVMKALDGKADRSEIQDGVMDVVKTRLRDSTAKE